MDNNFKNWCFELRFIVLHRFHKNKNVFLVVVNSYTNVLLGLLTLTFFIFLLQ